MPHRLKGMPRAFTKSSGDATGPRTANQARSAADVVFQRGSARSRRPLPRTRILVDCGATSSMRKPVSSETRRPAQTARCSIARSRTPTRVEDQERRAELAFPLEPRGNSAETRNIRLAAIRSFFRFLQHREPAVVEQVRRVLRLPFKKTDHRLVPFLAQEEMQEIG